jgi:hypothetical protein
MRCWQCGGPLTDPFKHPVEGVERALPLGEKVRLHKICAVTFDADQIDRIVTAKPTDKTFCLSFDTEPASPSSLDTKE